MTIKSTGVISMSDVSIELAFNSNAAKSLNDGDVRSLLGKSSGTISLSDAYGKSLPSISARLFYVAGGWVQTTMFYTCPQSFYVKYEGGILYYMMYSDFGSWKKWTGVTNISTLSYGTAWRNEGEGFRITSMYVSNGVISGTIDIYDANYGWRWTNVPWNT